MRIASLATASPLAAILAAAALAFGAPAMADPAPPPPSTISVSASADVSSPPEVAQVTAGVVTDGASASAAMAANSKQMSAVFAQLKKSGVPAKDIQTSGLNLNPVYAYNNNEAPRITGYQATNTVTVRLENLSKVGAAIDAIVASGVNQINGVSFAVKDPDSKLESARTEAAKKARAKAEKLAGAMGLKLGRVLSISEGGGYNPQPPMPMMNMAKEQSATSVAPGELQMSANVSATFELLN